MYMYVCMYICELEHKTKKIDRAKEGGQVNEFTVGFKVTRLKYVAKQTHDVIITNIIINAIYQLHADYGPVKASAVVTKSYECCNTILAAADT